MLTDWPLERLREYRPERVEPPNFAEFWRGTLDSARTAAAPARFRPYDAGLTTVEVYDLTFTGFGGHPIRGWFFLPRGGQEPLPCVVEYIGYGGGRGLPHEWLHWSAAGYAHLVMDTRGQGSNGWMSGDTPDPDASGGPQSPGFMTSGITDPRRQLSMAELYVPFSWHEAIWLEGHGIAEPGEGWRMIDNGDTELGGSFPINCSGGVLSSNPIGASGLLRFAEAALQVRGAAGEHQVANAKVALGMAYGANSQYFSMWVVASSLQPFG